MRAGGVVDDLLARIEGLEVPTDLADVGAALTDAVGAVREATAWILGVGDRPNDALAAAGPYLRMFGITLGGWAMARQAIAAREMGGGDRFAAAKLATARFYCAELLPQARGQLAALRAGAELLMTTPAEDLASS
jgi:hypothetical protein